MGHTVLAASAKCNRDANTRTGTHFLHTQEVNKKMQVTIVKPYKRQLLVNEE